MKIEKTRLLEIDDSEALALRGMAQALIDGGSVSAAALYTMGTWTKSHGQNIVSADPISAFIEIALFSLLLRTEAQRDTSSARAAYLATELDAARRENASAFAEALHKCFFASVYAGGARPDPGRCWTREADRLYLAACLGAPPGVISLATEEARAVAHTVAPGVDRSIIVLVCRDCGAEVERGQHCKAAGCPTRPGFTEEQADRKVLSVARDLLRRARIRLVDEPSAKELDAEIVAFLGKCPGATTGGSQRCTREQNHPGRCFDGKRTFVDRDPPSREVSYAEQRAEERAAQKSKE